MQCCHASGTGGRTSFDRLTVYFRSSHLVLNEQTHFCMSRIKVDEKSETRMAQSRETCLFCLFDRTVFSNSTVKTGHGHSFMKWDEMNWDSHQRTLTYFVRGNITVWLTSCLTGLDSAVLLNWNNKQTCLFGQILTGQTGGQAYSDISPYKVSECSLQSSTKIVRPPVPAIHMLHNLLITACHLGRCIPASLSAKEVCYSVNNHQSDKSSSTMTSVTRLLNLLDFGQLFKALGNN